MNATGEPVHIAVLVNRRAVPGRRRRPLLRRLEREAAVRPDVQVDVLHTHNAYAGNEAALAAARAGAGVVVAVGGDGTVQSVATGLLRAGESASERPVLMIAPFGRGNDLARALGYTRDVGTLIQAAVGGREGLLDVGLAQVDDRAHVFVNALGIGLDAVIARRARRLPLPGASAYPMATLGAILSERGPWHVKGSLGDRRIDRAVTLLSIGNGATTGGGFRLTPRARPDDGTLDYCMILERTRRGLLHLMGLVERGEHLGESSVDTGTLRRLEVRIDPPVTVHGDGEVFARAARSVHIEVEPSALRVRLPA